MSLSRAGTWAHSGVCQAPGPQLTSSTYVRVAGRQATDPPIDSCLQEKPL